MTKLNISKNPDKFGIFVLLEKFDKHIYRTCYEG